jgi:predicted permease
MRNLRYAIRILARSPGFTLAAVLVLALGIGANTAIFTVVRAVLLAPLPYANPDRLVRLYERNVIGDNEFNVVSPPNFDDWTAQAESYEQTAAYGDSSYNLAGGSGELPEQLTGLITTYNLFSTLGVQPVIGRAFLAEDDRPDAARTVILSDSIWRRRFGSNPRIVGSSIRLDGNSYTVVGVMPPGFDYPIASAQLWTPIWREILPRQRSQRGNHRLNVLARLKPGVRVEQARTELDGIARRIKQQYPEALTGSGANVAPLEERMVARVRPLLLVLLGAVACVLLIACVNVTNLLLARAMARRREVAIRAALGAGRAQLVSQFLTESLLLSGGGAILGLGFAAWGTDLLIKMAGDIPRIETVQVNASVLWFTAAVALVTGVIVGLAPAFTSARVALASAMQEGGRSSTAGRSRGIFRDVLVGIEIALSLVLLIGSGLMLKSFARLRSVDAGFSAERVLTMRFSLPAANYGTDPQRVAFFETLVSRVKTLPGVTGAGVVTVLPLAGHWSDTTFTIEGHPPLPPGQFLDAVIRSADPGYFQAMGIPLKRGRFFLPSERLEAANKAIISESMAKVFFPTEDPIGKRLNLGSDRLYEIVGIVGDVRKELAVKPDPMMYVPLLNGHEGFGSLVVRTAVDPHSLALPVQKEVSQIDPALSAINISTMDELAEGATLQKRFGMTLLGLFAGLALVLASIGLYGVLAYTIQQRTGELGVRIALGASPSGIARLVLWQGFKPAAAGLAVGLAASAAATRLIQALLFEVSPGDPQVLVGVIVLLGFVWSLACLVPAWRATRIDPVVALRAE